MTSRHTPFKPRAKPKVSRVATDSLPFDRDTNLDVTSRDVKTDDDELAHKEDVCRMTDRDPAIAATQVRIPDMTHVRAFACTQLFSHSS